MSNYSEDGREVVGYRVLVSGEYQFFRTEAEAKKERDEYESTCGPGDLDSVVEPDPLMTVAQHERILKTKDAEIVRWQGIAQKQWDEGDAQFASEIYQALDAVTQPARQVGGDEPVAVVDCSDDACWADILDDVTVKVGQKLYAHPASSADLDALRDEVRTTRRIAFNRAARICEKWRDQGDWDADTCNGIAAELRELAWDSASLAPAAVVVVVPERMATNNGKGWGWNAALDEVARLNRRAIPAGLLERIQVELDDYHSMDLIGTHGCDDELRALLGRD